MRILDSFMAGNLAVVASLFVSSVSPAVADDNLDRILAQFHKEAPSAWEKHRALTAIVSGSWHRVFRYSDRAVAGARVVVIDEDQKLGSNAAVGVHRSREEGGEPKPAVVMGYNSNYTFGLRKQTEADPWSVTNLATSSNEGIWSNARRLIVPANSFLTRMGNSILLDDHINDGNTQKTVERVDDDLVTISFVRRASGQQSPNDWDNATVTFDRAHYWIITNWRFSTPSGKTGEASLETRLVDGVPIILRRTSREFESKTATEPVVEGTEEFTLEYPPRPVSPEAFTLSAFGLPEPTASTPQPAKFPWFLVAALAGVICVALGLWRLRLRQR